MIEFKAAGQNSQATDIFKQEFQSYLADSKKNEVFLISHKFKSKQFNETSEKVYQIKDRAILFFHQMEDTEKLEKNPMFLEEMFKSLQDKKKDQHELPFIAKSQIYKGFKTIHIQKLQPRKMHKDPPINGKQLWKKSLVQTIHFYQESCHLSYKDKNGFFKAFCDAYMQHGDVKITPDDVWLTIMLYFSKYVYRNDKQLRKAFVQHNGKLDLVVNLKNQKEAGKVIWEQFLDQIIVQIRQKSVKGVTEHLECDFSSTDRFSRFLSTAMVMNAYKRYFAYKPQGGICGIQNIHMGGDLQDWLKLLKKLQFLRQFDVDGRLKSYVDRLMPVLQQFAQTYKGNPSLLFWNNIYHERIPQKPLYGVQNFINGWILRFFTLQNELTIEYGSLGLSIQELDVPIKYVDKPTKKVTNMALVGGCRGVSVEDQKVYRPHFSFSIVEKTTGKYKGHYEKI